MVAGDGKERWPEQINGKTRVGGVDECTVIQNIQKYRLKYWASCSSIHSFARTTHSFACSTLLASLARSAALIHSLARLLHSLPSGTVNDWMAIYSVFFSILDHSGIERSGCMLGGKFQRKWWVGDDESKGDGEWKEAIGSAASGKEARKKKRVGKGG